MSLKKRNKSVEATTSEKGENECKKKRESTPKLSLFAHRLVYKDSCLALNQANNSLPSSIKSVLQGHKSNHELKAGKKFIGKNEQPKSLKDCTKLKHDH